MNSPPFFKEEYRILIAIGLPCEINPKLLLRSSYFRGQTSECGEVVLKMSWQIVCMEPLLAYVSTFPLKQKP